MVRQTASKIILEILGGLILLVILAAAFLAFRLASGPLELGAFRDDVEQALTRARDGRPVTVERLQLEWSTDDRRVLVTAQGLKLMDGAGEVSAEAADAEIVLAGSALVTGKVEVLQLDLRSGWVNVDQQSATQWTVAGDPIPEIPAGTLPETLPEWLDRANVVLPALLGVLDAYEESLSLERVAFEAFDVRVRGKEGASILTLGNASGRLARTEGGLLMTLAGNGEGAGLPTGLGLTVETKEGGDRMHAEFAIADWPLADLATRFGIGVNDEGNTGGYEGLPANVDVGFDVSKATGLETIVFNADTGAGRLPIGKGGIDVADLKLIATYGAGDDQLALDVTSSSAGVFRGGAVLKLEDALKGSGPRKFAFESPGMVLALTPRFEAPLVFDTVAATGVLDIAGKGVTEMTLTTVTKGTTLKLTGDLAVTPDRVGREPPVLGNLQLDVPGELSKETVLAFWPPKLGDGARRWVVARLEEVTVTEAEAQIALKRDTFAEGFLRDEDLLVSFKADGAKVRFMDDLPPVEAASGRALMTGNGFKVILDQGKYGTWDLQDGVVEFPKFNPKGVPFRVFAKGTGPAQEGLQNLVDSRLKIDFDASRITGDADVTFEMFRPATGKVAYKDTKFSAIGTVKNGGLSKAAMGFDLTGGDAKIEVNPQGMTISGFGQLGPSPVQFTLRDGFRDNNAPADLSATAVVTPDVLNRFGLLGRAYLSGEIPVEMQALIRGEGVSSADFALDLTNSRVDLSEIGFVKPKGQSGKASVQYKKDGARSKSTVLFVSDEARLDGDFTLGEDSKLISAELRRAYLADRADVSGTVSRPDANTLNVDLKGTYLDISGAFGSLGAITGSKPVANNESEVAEVKTPVKLSAAVDTLTLRSGLDMRGAVVDMQTDGVRVRKLSAKGKADDGSALEASFDATGAGAAKLRVRSGDAGFLGSAFLGLDFIEGGALELDGTLPDGKGTAKFDIVVTDGRLRDAPFLTQILSLASLRGLADTLNGEGVLFSRIEVPLTISGGRYVVNGGKAQGPALGLTVNGYLEPGSGDIEFDGVLVPSFGLNSALGGIPIIGDLVVGRDGEGVFSLTYGVRGTLEAANVSVNPLSALAPGVIRRIFENPSDTSIPEAKTRAPDEPMPSELAPIPEEEF